MILEHVQIEYFLSMARTLAKSCPLYDIHVSPYEVIFCRFNYQPNKQHAGVYSLGDDHYQTPRQATRLKLETSANRSPSEEMTSVPSQFSLMMYKKLYGHIGPRVLGDHMLLSGISKSLLIPVAQPDSDGTEQFRLMFNLYQNDERFWFAYCVPNAIAAQDIAVDIQRVSAEVPLHALKIHPNIQQINIATAKGQERMQIVLAACQRFNLPLIIHGGISRVLEDPSSRAYAALDNLLHVDWRCASTPVVISHAGMFGDSSVEKADLLHKLQRLLSANDNVWVDISGLGFDALCDVLHHVDHDRIVFGSDALYFPQWSAVVKVLYALQSLGLQAEEIFSRLAGITPAKVFQDGSPCERQGAVNDKFPPR